MSLALTALLLIPPGWLQAPSADAADCGGTIGCQCGDRVVASVRLTADLGECSRTGLRIASGVTLDCAGHRIFGRSSKDGLFVEVAEGVRIRECTLEGFRTGIRVRTGRNVQISDNELRGNSRGIRVEEHSSDVVIERNSIELSRDLGIFVLDTSDARVSDNVIRDSGRENLKLGRAWNLYVEGNSLGGRPRMDLQLRDVKSSLFRNNEALATAIFVQGDSNENRFEDTDVLSTEYGFRFDTTEDREGGLHSPTGNSVKGGYILNAKRCFRFAGARDNQVQGVRVRECASRPTEIKNVDEALAVGNTVQIVPVGR